MLYYEYLNVHQGVCRLCHRSILKYRSLTLVQHFTQYFANKDNCIPDAEEMIPARSFLWSSLQRNDFPRIITSASGIQYSLLAKYGLAEIDAVKVS